MKELALNLLAAGAAAYVIVVAMQVFGRRHMEGPTALAVGLCLAGLILIVLGSL